jgi:hypothetical protein
MCLLTGRLNIVLTGYQEPWNNKEPWNSTQIYNDKTSVPLHVVKWLVPVRTCLCTTRSSRLNTHQSLSHHHVHGVRRLCRIRECWHNCHSWCNVTFSKLHICCAAARFLRKSPRTLSLHLLWTASSPSPWVYPPSQRCTICTSSPSWETCCSISTSLLTFCKLLRVTELLQLRWPKARFIYSVSMHYE